MFGGSPISLSGAFGEVNTNVGIFMRLDFPDFGNDELNVEFNSSTKSLTIRARVSEVENWPELGRIYATKVSFNQPISQNDFVYTLIKGSFRIFFSGKNLKTDVSMTRGSPRIVEANPTTEHILDIAFGNFGSRVPHPVGCRCCVSGQKFSIGEIGIIDESIHINPFVIGWNGGCLLKKLIKKDKGWTFHLLLEVPGLSDYEFQSSSQGVIVKGVRPKNPDHKLEVRGKMYFLSIKLKCNCCAFEEKPALHWLMNGLFGLTVQLFEK